MCADRPFSGSGSGSLSLSGSGFDYDYDYEYEDEYEYEYEYEGRSAMDRSLLSQLEPGHAIRLEPAEAAALLAEVRVLREEDSGMTGPIRVLGMEGLPDRWILECDTRRRPVLRRLRPWQDVEDFLLSRRESYERMWDG